MQRRLLLKSQANEVYNNIESSGLDVSEFQLRERDSTMTPDLQVSQLVHQPSGYYFIFDWRNDKRSDNPGLRHWAKFSPGEEAVLESISSGDWKTQFFYCQAWLHYLYRELDAPDLWGAIAQQIALIDSASDTDTPNTAFTRDEQIHIAERLDEISRQVITEHSLSREHAAKLQSQLAYLGDAAKHSGRRDWTLMALGLVFSSMLTGVVPPDAGRQLYGLLAKVFQYVLTHAHPPLL